MCVLAAAAAVVVGSGGGASAGTGSGADGPAVLVLLVRVLVFIPILVLLVLFLCLLFVVLRARMCACVTCVCVCVCQSMVVFVHSKSDSRISHWFSHIDLRCCLLANCSTCSLLRGIKAHGPWTVSHIWDQQQQRCMAVVVSHGCRTHVGDSWEHLL